MIKAALSSDDAHAAAAVVDQQGQTGSGSGTPEPPEAGAGGDKLETVVVTATPLSLKKRDASYSVMVADAEEIKESNPKSTADLMRISPGIWPESTGGQTGANIDAQRGITDDLFIAFVQGILDVCVCGNVRLDGIPSAQINTRIAGGVRNT